jgi:hypothetical protein
MKRSLARETVARYRRRARRRGLVRLEVQVAREDAEPVRALAALLRDAPPEAARRAREGLLALLRAASGSGRLKDLLAAAPLEGIEIPRSRDLGRPTELP